MHEQLLAVLERSRTLGFLGPGPVSDHVEHAGGFLEALPDDATTLVDLGSGGGVPGLVLAVARPHLQIRLVDATAKRCRFLEEAVGVLGLANTQVVQGRAEVVGRGELRGWADVVVARSFGAPAVTAECAAPLLHPGGRLVVSEPPDAQARWDAAGLARLGLRLDRRSDSSPVMQLLVQTGPCPDEFPRRDGVPGKHPLFDPDVPRGTLDQP